ncbi:rho GTPase-activating protein 11A [Neosynchiropus ocellatus]
MKAMERDVMRLVAVQHLRSAFGIKTKNWNKNKAAVAKSTATSNSVKVFGVPLESLPYYNVECGSVPRFLVDACMKLLAHVDTEGLFRKSGSVVRLKALRAKLDSGEECLSSALPCDVAGLVKQFFRELPEPVLPTELHEAFLKAQQLSTEEDRTSATMLLSCVLPERNLSVLRHFFDFLQNVSERSNQNKMDSSNLSVILAPNLLHSGEGAEKMNANTEKRLKLQAAVVHCFIDHAHDFGVLPQFLADKVPAMMGCEGGVLSPGGHELEELDTNAEFRRRTRRSFGVFSSATPVTGTPSKRKLPLESGQSFGLSSKKRKSVKKTLGIDLLPSSLFSGTSTPGSAYSASGVLESSQTNPSPAGRARRQTATSVKRRSRLSSRHAVNRVESGRTGCFSPKAGKKEAPRKSLRLRFSLGKSHKDPGSESIGWRLATQESTTSFCFTKETPEFSPSVRRRQTETKSSHYMSKSEDNLLTPKCEPRAHRTAWTRETPLGAPASSCDSFNDTPMSMCLKNTYASEPAIAKPPTGSGLAKTLCCAVSADSLCSQTQKQEVEVTGTEADQADLKETKASDSFLFRPPQTPPAKVSAEPAVAPGIPTPQSLLGDDQNVTFGHFDIAALSPLHIDSVVFESGGYSPAIRKASFCHDSSVKEEEEPAANCSRLIDALDIQSPAHFRPQVSCGLQSTPYKSTAELKEELYVLVEEPLKETDDQVQNQPADSPPDLEQQKARVADHIQHFNTLTLYSPRGSKPKQTRSPIKFERTPVRQAVRRINSLMGDGRRPACNREVVKAVSMESGLSPRCLKKKPPPVPPKKPGTLARLPKSVALGDVTNKIPSQTKVDTPEAPRSRVQQVTEKDSNYYRGSPRNPLNQSRLLSATKPVDL